MVMPLVWHGTCNVAESEHCVEHTKSLLLLFLGSIGRLPRASHPNMIPLTHRKLWNCDQ